MWKNDQEKFPSHGLQDGHLLDSINVYSCMMHPWQWGYEMELIKAFLDI